MSIIHNAFDIVAAASNDVRVIRIAHIHLHNDTSALQCLIKEGVKMLSQIIFRVETYPRVQGAKYAFLGTLNLLNLAYNTHMRI